MIIGCLSTYFKNNFAGDSLKSKALVSSFMTIFGFGAQQFIRLIANLILTRILFPDAFGIMAIGMVVMTALTMFSDVGLNISIIQNQRGEERVFRNTTWSLQIIRGFCIWLLAALCAYPMSIIYGEPILFPVIFALGATSAIQGFATTAVAVENKNLNLFKLTLIKLSVQVINISTTILIAYLTKSIWALVAGNFTSAIIGTIVEHRLLNKGFKHQFLIDKHCTKELISFGKWIFFSSLVGFLANHADRLILGKALSVTGLGIYTVAITLAQLPMMVFSRLSGRVLVPIYSKLQTSDISEVRRKIVKIRLRLIALLAPISLVMVLFGDHIVEFMYDHRYSDAGWMTQVLAFGFCVHIVMNIGNFYLGFGKSRVFFSVTTMKAIFLIVSMLVGNYFYGSVGLVFGVAVANILYCVMEMLVYKHYDLWVWKFDLIALPVLLAFGVYTFIFMLDLPS